MKRPAPCDPCEATALECNGAEKPKRRKDEKNEVMRINKRLKELGQRKQGQRAFDIFTENFGPLDGTGTLRPSVHSFTNLVNAFVRVGKVDEAKRVIAAMKLRGFEPNVVTLTTLLKGLCEQGSMQEAEQLESNMDGNERSLSTLLRGCLRWGAIDCSLRRWRSMEGCCDDVSREYLVKSLCCALRVTTARQVLEGTTPSVASALALAEAELLLGHRNKCKRLLLTAKHAPIVDSDTVDESSLFLKHKKQEYERTRLRLRKSKAVDEVTPHFRRFFYFRPTSCDSCCAGGSTSSTALPRSLARETRGIGLRKSQLEEDVEWKRKCFTDDGLSLKALDVRPLKLEIGSGDGEWIVQHAPQDSSSLWAALELRYDRCARTWSQMCLEGVDNMVILGGDAHRVVALLPKNSVAEVVSFYPEPPAWHEGVWDSEAPHLWTESFLAILGDKLQVAGELRICSDNKKYLELIKSYCPSTLCAKRGDSIEVESGRIDDSDTYFDRLWSCGKKRKRFNLCLRRV